MQFTTAILAFAATAFAAPNVAPRGQCTFGEYACSHDGLSIKQCNIDNVWVVSLPFILSSPQFSPNRFTGGRRLPHWRPLRLRQHQRPALLLRPQEGPPRRRRHSVVRGAGHLHVHGRRLGHRHLQRAEPARAERGVPSGHALRGPCVGERGAFLRGELGGCWGPWYLVGTGCLVKNPSGLCRR